MNKFKKCPRCGDEDTMKNDKVVYTFIVLFFIGFATSIIGIALIILYAVGIYPNYETGLISIISGVIGSIISVSIISWLVRSDD